MTFAPIKGQCPVCRQDAGLNLDPIVSFSESKQLAELRAENASLKEVISLSEDSRLMDEYLKLERANARQAERIKEQAAEIERLKKSCDSVGDANERLGSRVIAAERTATQQAISDYLDAAITKEHTC